MCLNEKYISIKKKTLDNVVLYNIFLVLLLFDNMIYQWEMQK